MKSPTPEQIARLPRWARQHIRSLVNHVEALRGPSQTEPSNVWTREYLNPRNFIQQDRILFGDPGLHNDGEYYFEVMRDPWFPRAIQVRGYSGMIVIPNCSNVVTLALGDARKLPA